MLVGVDVKGFTKFYFAVLVAFLVMAIMLSQLQPFIVKTGSAVDGEIIFMIFSTSIINCDSKHSQCVLIIFIMYTRITHIVYFIYISGINGIFSS